MKFRRSLSWVLIAAGLTLCAMAARHYVVGIRAQQRGLRAFEKRRARENPGIVGVSSSIPAGLENYPRGEPIARLRIPSARIDAIVFGGADAESLEKGPGHVPGTELPGRDTGVKNCVITGHRDSHFRHLGRLQKGQRIELETPSGNKTYEVVSREIVEPTAVRVLAPTQRPRLTLITCYPFDYVGPAPKRFVLVAEPVSEPFPRSDVGHSS